MFERNWLYTDHCLMVAEVRQVMLVSKGAKRKYDMEKFRKMGVMV
jgi:hypothetical protein